MSLINREDLIAEYDRVHVGAPGGARKLMVDAPEVQSDRMKLVQQAVNTIMNTSRSYSIRDRAFRNAARLVQNAIDGKAPDFEQIPEGDEMPSESKLIPCNERLPEVGQWVLCQCRAGIFDVLLLTNEGEWNSDCATYMSSFVIAWAPLPEPWRGESNDRP